MGVCHIGCSELYKTHESCLETIRPNSIYNRHSKGKVRSDNIFKFPLSKQSKNYLLLHTCERFSSLAVQRMFYIINSRLRYNIPR